MCGIAIPQHYERSIEHEGWPYVQSHNKIKRITDMHVCMYVV